MTEKKEIPNPDDVPEHMEEAVIVHVMEQMGFAPIPGAPRHYWPEPGSFQVDPDGEGRDVVTFVRLHDVKVPAAPHGLDLESEPEVEDDGDED